MKPLRELRPGRILSGVFDALRGSGRKGGAPPPQGPASPPSDASTSRRATVHAGWLIDGSGAPARRDVRLQIRDGILERLEDMGPASAPSTAARAGAKPGERDCTVLPGLIDSHVHLAMTGVADEALRARLRDAPYEAIRRMIVENLCGHLRHGVVAVRDGGGARGSVLRFVGGAGGRCAVPVRIRAAGRAWHRQGRYGRLIGRIPADGRSLAEAIRTDGERVDHIKVVNSGLNSLTEYGKQTAPQFTTEELAAAVRAAAGRGLAVMVHANGDIPVRSAVLAGCRSVEHGFFMGADNLARMADRGTVWVPTAVTMHAYAALSAQTGRNPDVARRTLDHQLEQLSRARRLGVTVALGTDAGSPGVQHGAAVAEEMRLFMQAGFSLPEAVACAAVNAARLVGAAHGLLAPGRPATFVVVEGPPSSSPEFLERVRAVFVDGIRRFEAG